MNIEGIVKNNHNTKKICKFTFYASVRLVTYKAGGELPLLRYGAPRGQ